MNRKQTLNWIKIKQFKRMVKRVNDLCGSKYPALAIMNRWYYDRNLKNI